MTHAPGTTAKYPNAKDDLRARARELRLQGRTYDQIQLELGVSKSSISLWVRDLPRPERRRSTEQASAIAKRGWEARLRHREEERRHVKAAARQAVGEMTDREAFLTGVALHWAEGAKDKPYARRERLHFINSDPNVILKKHKPNTVRKNTAENYRGCLIIYVLQSADLYRRMEGAWYGIVGAAAARDHQNRT
jgi:transposase